MPQTVSNLVTNWSSYATAMVLVMLRLSALVAFAPFYSSAAISPRVKAVFVFAVSLLVAPAAAVLPGARHSLDLSAILGELAVGLTFALSLAMLSEAVNFAGSLLGMEFSFSLVNLLDPNSRVDSPVLSELLNWMTMLLILSAGLHRTLLMAVVRSFAAVPVGSAVLLATSAHRLVQMAGDIFLSGLQLAAPVLAAALTVEVTVSLIGRLSPQLPVLFVSVPLKTMVSYLVLIASLAVWPGWVERHFNLLLDHAAGLLARG
ncbi:MAG: flagellar biosynthetic protein FliR [Acidobacteriota bacterium]|nr:flagellar biosynthetic protein FliR [Acidobacteriota bacterium]